MVLCKNIYFTKVFPSDKIRIIKNDLEGSRMNMAIASLIALALSIVLGFVRKLNVGIVAIALAYIIGIAYGLSAKDITGGFSSSMAMTMIGVMYLFAIVSKNGTLELLAKKITGLARGNRYLLYVAIYVIGIILSGVGPGAIPTLAIVPVLAIPVALKAGMNPILLSLIGQMGAQCVRMCPITPEAVVVRDLMVEQGLDGNTLPAMWSLWATEIVMIIAAFIFFKGWKFDKPLESVELEETDHFSPKQILTLIGLLAMIAGVVVFGFDVGLTSLVIGTILLVCGCADEKVVIKSIPWNTILMVLGVGVLMNIVSLSGGVELLAGSISNVSSASTISPMMCLVASVMSFFASGLGVVFPTLVPTVGSIAAEFGGAISPIELMASVVIGGTVAGFTPISTAGALIQAGVSQFPEVENKYSQNKMFVELFIIAFLSTFISVAMAVLGVYGVICG